MNKHQLHPGARLQHQRQQQIHYADGRWKNTSKYKTVFQRGGGSCSTNKACRCCKQISERGLVWRQALCNHDSRPTSLFAGETFLSMLLMLIVSRLRCSNLLLNFDSSEARLTSGGPPPSHFRNPLEATPTTMHRVSPFCRPGEHIVVTLPLFNPR